MVTAMPHNLPISNQDPHMESTIYDLHKVHLDSIPNSSHTSSPSLPPIDPRSPIFEEEEETASEAGNEPLTPASTRGFQDGDHRTTIVDDHQSYYPPRSHPALVASPTLNPPCSVEKERPIPGAEQAVKSPTNSTHGRSTSNSKDVGIKRAVAGLFRRSNTASAGATLSLADHSNMPKTGSDTMLEQDCRRMSIKQGSMTTTPSSTEFNTPSSPRSISEADSNEAPPAQQSRMQSREPSFDEVLFRKQRASTGFSLKGKLLRPKIQFAGHPKSASGRPERASSFDIQKSQPDSAGRPELQDMPRRDWGIGAAEGTGAKSRRISLSVPADAFDVDAVELYSEYADQSKLIGKRGKIIGNGATASVKLMKRKGGVSSDTYAVKEFRPRSSKEQTEDYENKIKSEFSIARSAHHPNIVETFQLCTHNGRWNHVMEFCEGGDLYTLVNRRYLDKSEHHSDRLCLFKQLVQGLDYLHLHGIAHRDVKLENLLITKDSKLKITDFGVSEVFSGIHPGFKGAAGHCGKAMSEIRFCSPGVCGSPPYIAPEVLEKKENYDPRLLDVWGAAIVMICMSLEKWDKQHEDIGDGSITELDYPRIRFFEQKITSPPLRRMLLTMLHPDPKKRASMADAANNRWMKKVECCQVNSFEDPKITIDAAKAGCCKGKIPKIIQHNHLPPTHHHGHRLVRLPGST